MILNPGKQVHVVYGVTAVVAVWLGFITYSKFSRRLTLLFTVTAALLAYFLTDIKGLALTAFKAVASGAFQGNEVLICTLASVFVLVLSFYISYDEKAVYTLAVVAAIWTAVMIFTGSELDYVHILPVLTAFMGFYARSGGLEGAQLKALVSTGLVCVLVAFYTVPSGGVTEPHLRAAADSAIRFVIRTLNLDRNDLESRRTFDIGSYGWRTLYSSFGGPAYPTDVEILRVKADETLYLRGSVRYIYNGRAWADESNNEKAGKIRRYMVSGVEGMLYRNEYKKAFDLDKKAALAMCTPKTAEVTVLDDNLYWAVYTPDRVDDVSLDSDTGLYYNNIGELFAAKQLKAGERYSFTYYSSDDMGAVANTCTDEKDAALSEVLMLYLSVPQGIDSELYALVAQLTSGSGSEYAAAEAICSYLKTNGKYTLNPGYVPENRDFVSYFVLDDMRGYCSYYAAAMTLMARMANLPARYIEGYLAEPDENGECIVTGKDAHAWSEVYFAGCGWVTFDATPGYDDSRDTGKDAGENIGPQRSNEPENTPEPTFAPTVTPSPTDTPAPEPESSEETPKPTPSSVDRDERSDDTPEPFENVINDTDGHTEASGSGGLLWLILIIPIVFVAVRLRLSSVTLMLRRKRDSRGKLCVLFRAILNCLKCAGIPYMPGDTPLSFADKAIKAGRADGEFEELGSLMSLIMYSNAECTHEDVEFAREVYAMIRSKMGIGARARLLFMRIRRGFGSTEILP